MEKHTSLSIEKLNILMMSILLISNKLRMCVYRKIESRAKQKALKLDIKYITHKEKK